MTEKAPFLLHEWPAGVARARKLGHTRFGKYFDGNIYQMSASFWGYKEQSHLVRALHRAAVAAKIKINTATFKDGDSVIVQKVTP